MKKIILFAFVLMCFFSKDVFAEVVGENDKKKQYNIQNEIIPPYVFTWDLNQIKMDNLWNRGLTGKNINIAVIDSGVNSSHEDLKGVVKENYACINKNPCEKVDENEERVGSHGTHVTGIIASNKNDLGRTGVAYNTKISSFRFKEEADKPTSSENVTNALEYIFEKNKNSSIEDKIHLINISAGNMEFSGKDYEKRKDLIQKLYDSGVLIVASAGNKGDINPEGITENPAIFKNVISVGALNDNEEITDFSARGKVDISAPGESVWSSVPTTETFKLNYGSRKGTSQAAPFVTGTLALYKELFPHYNNEELKKVLYEQVEYVEGNGEKTDENGFKINEDYGRGKLKVGINYTKLYDGLGDKLYPIIVNSSNTRERDYVMDNNKYGTFNSSALRDNGWIKYRFDGKANGVSDVFFQTGALIKDDKVLENKNLYIEFLDEKNQSLGEYKINQTGWSPLEFNKPFTYFVLKNKGTSTIDITEFELYDKEKRYELPKKNSINQTLYLSGKIDVYSNVGNENKQKIDLPMMYNIKSIEAFGWLDREKRFEWYKISIPELNLHDVWIKPSDREVNRIYLDGLLDKKESKMILNSIYGKPNAINDNFEGIDQSYSWFRNYYDSQSLEFYFSNPTSLNAVFVSPYYGLKDNGTLKLEFFNGKKELLGSHIISEEESGRKYFSLPQTYNDVSRIKITSIGKEDVLITEMEFFNALTENETLEKQTLHNIQSITNEVQLYDRPVNSPLNRVKKTNKKIEKIKPVQGEIWNTDKERYEWYKVEYENEFYWALGKDFNVEYPFLNGLLDGTGITMKKSSFVSYEDKLNNNNLEDYTLFYPGQTYMEYTFPDSEFVKSAFLNSISLHPNNYGSLKIEGINEQGNVLFSHKVTEQDIITGYFDIVNEPTLVKTIRLKHDNSFSGNNIREFDVFQ